MTPLEINFSPAAAQDLLDIWDYISSRSLRGAEGVIREIGGKLDMLALNPEAGVRRDSLLAEVRSFPAASFGIYYRATSDTLVVLRILHAARDVTTDLLKA